MLSVFWGGSLNWPNLYGYNHLCLIGVALAYPQMMIDVMLLSGCLSRLFLLQNPRLSHLLASLIFFSSLIFFFLHALSSYSPLTLFFHSGACWSCFCFPWTIHLSLLPPLSSALVASCGGLGESCFYIWYFLSWKSSLPPEAT